MYYTGKDLLTNLFSKKVLMYFYMLNEFFAVVGLLELGTHCNMILFLFQSKVRYV